MNCVLACLNWAYLLDWLPSPPKLRKLKTPKLKVMKGRPITETEFDLLLNATAAVVGEELLQGDSRNSHFWHRHGTILALLERPTEAIASLRRAVQIAPEDADYCVDLARQLRAHDGVDAAIAELQRGAQAVTVLSQKRRLRQMIARYQSEAQSTHHG